MDFRKLVNSGVARIKPYIPGKPVEEIEKHYTVKNPLKMNSNENPLGTSPSALDTAARTLHRANSYPESSSRELRETLSQKYGLSPDNFIAGNGGDEIFYYTAMAFLNDQDQVVIPRITFPIYETACSIMRAAIVYSRMDGNQIDLEDILSKITPGTKMLFLCNPNNPTGHAYNHRQVEKFVRRVPEHVLVVVDEAYGDFADMPDFPDTVSLLNSGCHNLIVAKTLSKSHGFAGLRVGYGIAHKQIIEIMNRIRIPFNLTLISQKAAVSALQDHRFLQKSLCLAREGKKLMYQELQNMGLEYVRSHTNYILIDTFKDSDLVTEQLHKKGVIVRSAKNYGYPTCIRVTVGTKQQNERFLEALEQVIQELE
ncbi:MAG: histidinol-phosphate transaminase [Spirochaetota bacterium]